MSVRHAIHIMVLLLSQMFNTRDMALSQQCTNGGFEVSILGWKLQRHIYKTLMANLGHECLLICRRDDRCQSFNWVISLSVCELNDRTKEARPEDFVPDQDRYYFTRDIKRVALGSIPELPAETCKEIKASEGQAVSKKYWLSYLKPGIPVFAHCDMETGDVDECSASSPVCDVNALCANTRGSYFCTCKVGYSGDGKTCQAIKSRSCDDIKRIDTKASDGSYTVSTSSTTVQVYCDMTTSGQGWTLVARFSNNDAKNWMEDSGDWWYDKNVAVGKTTEPSKNTDMISPAFWLVSGNEFKITSSNDPQHTSLLQTTGDCLGGQTFRSKITSYGDYRNGTVWSNDQCLGNCTVQYGGQYQTISGFKQTTCNGNIQSANAVGFWCNWSTGDGAVMMIGGGGSECQRADHGIGITEANQASFNDGGTAEHDFGDEANRAQNSSYSINLWVR